MTIIGVIDSAKTGRLITNNFYNIATASGGSAQITFNSIPQTYTHLQVRAITKCGGTTGASEWYVWFNNDTTASNYWKIRYFAYGSTGTAQNSSVGSEGIWGSPDSRGSSLGAAAFTMDVHNYTSSLYKNTVIRGMGGGNGSTDLSVGLAAGPWISSSAISRIDFAPNQGSFTSGTRFALYGIL